eukprot:2253219-Alexandrium_andersonii.AAC.1
MIILLTWSGGRLHCPWVHGTRREQGQRGIYSTACVEVLPAAAEAVVCSPEARACGGLGGR